jgi:rod shape-determining protein MreC
MKFFSKKNPVFIFIVILVILVLLYSFTWLKPVEIFLNDITKPVNGYFYNLGSFFNRPSDKPDSIEYLQIKLEEAEKEIARLNVANSQQQELEEENKKLRAQLNLTRKYNFQTVTAEVIARESLLEGIAERQDLVINKGLEDDLALGQGVVSEEGVIIGKIIEVKEASAKICLTINSGCKLAAAILNQNRTQGITDGDLGLTIKMNYIPQLEKISVGDTVITSGLGEKIPRGLVIGKIIDIRNESNEVWQDATIEPLVNLNNLTVVSIIIP